MIETVGVTTNGQTAIASESAHLNSSLTSKRQEHQLPITANLMKQTLVGKHFYCDLFEVVVTVVNEHLIEINGSLYRSAKGVEVEPWWTHPLAKAFWVKREELETVTLSCELIPDSAHRMTVELFIPEV